MLAGITDCRESQRREREPRGFGGVGGENHTALAEWEPHGSDTADGAGSLNHGLLLLFLRYGTPDWAEGEGRTVCICGCFKGLRDFNEDIKSLLLSLYNF